MGFQVFISYSTKDFPLVERVRQVLTLPNVDVFVAEYSVTPGTNLNLEILNHLRSCDLFVLLWTANSRASEYVQQEIGVARGAARNILPVVLGERLELPAFISDMKYLPAYRNPTEAMQWLRQHVLANALAQQRNVGLALLGLAVAVLWVLSE
jgi:hypothetical protein